MKKSVTNYRTTGTVIDFFGITIWYRRSACTDAIF